MRIYLADLGHNQVTMSSDTYPLGVANLATYLQAFLRSDRKLDVRIFREPEDLRAALDGPAPDVLAVASYDLMPEIDAGDRCRRSTPTSGARPTRASGPF